MNLLLHLIYIRKYIYIRGKMNKFISVIEYCALRKHYDETIKINTKCGRKTKQLHMQDNKKKKKIVLNILVGSKNMVK